jgi:UrcA family protein
MTMTNSITTKIASAVLAVCASTVSLAEVAQAETVEFAYSPVELNSAQGAADLDNRIRKFARQSCRFASPLITVGDRRECREDIEAQLRDAIASSAK